MKVRRRNVTGRSGNPQHTKGVSCFLRTNQNMGNLPKRSYSTAVADSRRVGSNILFHLFTKANPDWPRSFLPALSSGANDSPGRTKQSDLRAGPSSPGGRRRFFSIRSLRLGTRSMNFPAVPGAEIS
jgi:hypothetical protein